MCVNGLLQLDSENIVECDDGAGVYILKNYKLELVSVPYADIADLIEDYIQSNIHWKINH